MRSVLHVYFRTAMHNCYAHGCMRQQKKHSIALKNIRYKEDT